MNSRTLLAIVTILAAVIAYLVWDGYEHRRIIADLSPADRRVVFENTLEAFQKLCVDRSGAGFDKYCDTQRDFLTWFPECDSSCTLLLAKEERVPTR